jgi:hypothetical protein
VKCHDHDAVLGAEQRSEGALPSVYKTFQVEITSMQQFTPMDDSLLHRSSNCDFCVIVLGMLIFVSGYLCCMRRRDGIRQ